MPTPSLREQSLCILGVDDPGQKADAARALFVTVDSQPVGAAARLHAGRPLPGRPARPRLLDAREVASGSPFTPGGRARLLHAIAHIEFNAINLALDAVWRFAALPDGYYRDWLRVASEESLHFRCCASTCARSASTTATSTLTTACG